MNRPTAHSWIFTYRWLLWSVYGILWTFGLLFPQPERVVGTFQWTAETKLIVAKLLHFFAYAVFTILTSWLAVPTRYRWLAMFGLMAHAGVTEFLQQFLLRYGMVADVCINFLGIFAGSLVSWKRWCGDHIHVN